MSLATGVTSSTVTKQGGMLLSLPRELRDTIYGYVLKNTYLVCAQPRPTYIGTWVLKISPNLSILRVSKTVSDEAMAVFFSESIFRIYVYFERDETHQLSSIPSVKRMMNIELDVKIDSTVERLESSRQIWTTTLGCISRTNNLRNTLNVRWRRIFFELIMEFEPDWSNTDPIIPDWMFRKLKSMTRFRTVVLQNFIHKDDTLDQKWRSFFDKYETTTIRNHLTRVLGPADSVSAPRDPQCAVYLTFHPQEHMSALLKARAADLRAKADELELEAKRAEEGV